MEKKKIGQMGPIKGWGPCGRSHCHCSLPSWRGGPPKLLLFISPVLTSDFPICDLQVRVLAKGEIGSLLLPIQVQLDHSYKEEKSNIMSLLFGQIV